MAEEILYHYCKNETLVKIISNGTLRLSCLDGANDHAEGNWLLDMFIDRLKAEAEQGEATKTEMKLRGIRKQLLGFSLSFSKKGDLLSQWRGYADDGGGVAIGFRRTQLEEIVKYHAQYINMSLCSVEYGQDAQTKFIDDYVGFMKDNFDKYRGYTKNVSPDLASEWINRLISNIYWYKNSSFSEEAEVRIVTIVPPVEGNESLWRDHFSWINKPGVMVPFWDLPMPEDRSKLIGRIFLGPKNNTSETALQFWLRAQGYGEVEIVRSAATYR